jgi:hypothetical protein
MNMVMQQMLDLLQANQDLLARMEADRQRDRDDLKRMEAKLDTNWTEMEENLRGMIADMNAKMDGNQAQMRSTICEFQ